MRWVPVVVAGAVVSGCLPFGVAANVGLARIGAGLAWSALSATQQTERSVELTREGELERLRQHSRSRMYPRGEPPRCAVRIEKTAATAWTLSSCDGELRCWARADWGYDCEPMPERSSPQL